MCANWNFFNESTFDVNNGSADDRLKTHWFKYYFDGTAYGKTSVMKYCMYSPEVDNVAGFANDANAISFAVTDFTLPNYSGLKWPADIYTAIGGTKVIK